MATIALQLDTQTLECAQKLAVSRQCTLEALLKALIERLGTVEADDDPLLGMFADESIVIDQVVASAMHARELHPLRQNGA